MVQMDDLSDDALITEQPVVSKLDRCPSLEIQIDDVSQPKLSNVASQIEQTKLILFPAGSEKWGFTNTGNKIEKVSNRSFAQKHGLLPRWIILEVNDMRMPNDVIAIRSAIMETKSKEKETKILFRAPKITSNSFREVEVIKSNSPKNSDMLEHTLGELSLEHAQLANSQKKNGSIKTNTIGIDNFQLLKVIGRGSYGKVFQVKKKENNQIYAMKVLQKKIVIKRKVVGHTNSERQVLSTVNHPFIVNLRYAFQSPSKLYLILDYIPGGELFKRLDEVYEFSEPEARFYTGEIILVLEHLHSLDIIYRDLKPENIMLGQDGHIILTDFGFAKAGVETDSDTKTFCGTPQYMAPETILKRGHGKAADWWTLGIVLYEMLTGKVPFRGRNRKQIQQNILTGKLRIEQWIGGSARILIKGLLRRSMIKRLGSGSKGATEVKTQEFFGKDFDWVALGNKEVKPPWMPTLKLGKFDTSNFDNKFTSELVINSPSTSCTDPPTSPGLFRGFYYEASPSFGPMRPGNLHYGKYPEKSPRSPRSGFSYEVSPSFSPMRTGNSHGSRSGNNLLAIPRRTAGPAAFHLGLPAVMDESIINTTQINLMPKTMSTESKNNNNKNNSNNNINNGDCHDNDSSKNNDEKTNKSENNNKKSGPVTFHLGLPAVMDESTIMSKQTSLAPQTMSIESKNNNNNSKNGNSNINNGDCHNNDNRKNNEEETNKKENNNKKRRRRRRRRNKNKTILHIMG